MYCVQCGVRLGDGADKCPLCETPVWNPSGTKEQATFPQVYPDARNRHKHAMLFTITLLSIIVCAIVFMVFRNYYRNMALCGVVDLGILLWYILFIFPFWFKKPNPVIFLPIGHVATAGYLLYLCLWSNGNWFLSFAGPIILASMLLTTTVATLLRYVRGGRYFIFGGLFFLLAGVNILIEGLAHLTFGIDFAVWSPYTAGLCGAVAIVLILAGIIRPMRDFFNRMFFI